MKIRFHSEDCPTGKNHQVKWAHFGEDNDMAPTEVLRLEKSNQAIVIPESMLHLFAQISSPLYSIDGPIRFSGKDQETRERFQYSFQQRVYIFVDTSLNKNN